MGAQRDRWGLPWDGEGFRLPRGPHRPLLLHELVFGGWIEFAQTPAA